MGVMIVLLVTDMMVPQGSAVHFDFLKCVLDDC